MTNGQRTVTTLLAVVVLLPLTACTDSVLQDGGATSSEAEKADVLSTEDADAIKSGLLQAIAASDDPGIRELHDEVREEKAWIDASGTLYLGSWRFDRRKGRLIKRPLRAREGPVFEADVQRSPDGWIVGNITVGRQVAP